MITSKYGVPYLIAKEEYKIFDIQEVEDQGIIRFIQNNLFSNDHVLFYAESTDNILINLIAMQIVRNHGSTTFTVLSQQTANLLDLSAAEGGMQGNY